MNAVNQKKPVVDITPQELFLLRRVSESELKLGPLMYHIAQLTRVKEACELLIAARLTGKNLLDFWVIEKQRSNLAVLEFITKGLEGQARQLFIGRDLRPH